MSDPFLASALANLFSAPVLAFALGIFAVAVRSDLALPESLQQSLSIYLLLAIGVKGGVGLRASRPDELFLALGIAIVVGISSPMLAFFALRILTRLDRLDRGAIAAHYGSTSLVTFTAGLAFLNQADIPAPGYATTLLTVLEVPGIVVGLLLAQSAGRHGLSKSIHEVVTGKSIMLLGGGLVIGAVIGNAGFEPLKPFFSDLYRGVLVLFLLGLGLEVGSRLTTVRSAGAGLLVFAILYPLSIGSAVSAIAVTAGLPVGAAIVLALLSASASYIAAPAAVRFSLPKANLAIALTSSVAVTFPVNLLVGIPLYAWIARAI